MKPACFLFAFTSAIVSILSCNAQKTDKESVFDAYIIRTADSIQKTQKAPGIFIGVLDGGRRKYFSFGYADREQKLPFDSATLFEIGSITKTFTAYVLQAVLRQRAISDSSSILPYLPDSVNVNKALQNITFLSLTNHTSGLPRLPGNMPLSGMSPYDHYTVNDLFSFLRTCVPQPDGKSNYSNLGAGLAGVLAQAISGKSYNDLLQEHIFQPFRITFHPDETIDSTMNKGQGYFETIKSPYWKAAALAPAGALKCSAGELLTYFQCMSNPVNAASKEIIDKLLENTATVAPGINVCRGWHTREEKKRPVIYWHNGGTYGFSCFGAFIREQNKAVVVVVNQFNRNMISDQLGFSIIQKMAE
jgi:CubicO group peptidase (beta-lactamase class C family)